MALKAALFDLDGTLLPLEQDAFIAAYIKQMVTYLARFGYDPKAMAAAVWVGSEDMICNDGSATNETVFWKRMTATLGPQVIADQPNFERYYMEEYHRLQDICGCDPDANALVQRLKSKGIRVILATNPVFPAIATDQRIAWAGLDKADFELVTTYENSTFCKPSIQYYAAIMEQLGLKAEECIMVGNDILDDMPARELGMKVFLLTDHLVNRKSLPLDAYPHGGFKELRDYIEANL